MKAYFYHHLSNNNIILLNLPVELSDHYVELSEPFFITLYIHGVSIGGS